MTSDQKASILALADKGLSSPQIAVETGVGRATVYRLLKGRHPGALIRLVADPSGIFSPRRAGFGMLDVALGVRDGVWAEGTAFEITGRRAEVSEGQLVCGDRQLEVETDGKYRWVERCK